jgi:hypothetical protein
MQHTYEKNGESLVDFFIRPANTTKGYFSVGDSGKKNDWRIWLKGDMDKWVDDARVGRFGIDDSGGLYSTSG